jgi:glycosyltransferase involved in cell wall biosynthesis
MSFGQVQCHSTGRWSPVLRTVAFATLISGFGSWQRPDLIITTHLNFTRVAYWLKRLFGIPYLTIAHGVEAWNIQHPDLNRGLTNADLILAISRYTSNRLVEEQNLDPNKVVLLPNTFDPASFKIGPKPGYLMKHYGLTPEQPIILTVCRLAPSEQYKGYDTVLRALPEIRRRVPNVHYIIVGQGDDRARVESLIEQLSLKGVVTLAGYVPDSELSDYYNLCDIFAMPSKAEGFGIVYLEALACGKPVLAGNKDGSRDALADGELGLLVDPDDTAEIAAEIIGVLRREHPHPNIFRPEFLRQRVTELFGFATFKRTVAEHLRPFLGDDGGLQTTDRSPLTLLTTKALRHEKEP